MDSHHTGYDDGRVHEEVDAGRPRPVSHEGDRVGVAGEAGNVLLDPLERRDLVHQPVVGHARLAGGVHVRVEEAWGT